MTNKTFYLHSSFETKAAPSSPGSIKIAGYANTTNKDRSGDVVTAQAWAKGIENFRKNPVMLFQHKHDCPIGKFDKITVDKKGIYVEGTVSSAAEKNYGVQTLIKDGALKSFSVGFRVLDGKYNNKDDSTTITEVELLEISIVSVPCNQDSLFSLRKSFDSSDDYSAFVKTLVEDEIVVEEAVVEIKADTEEVAVEEPIIETITELLSEVETVKEVKAATAEIIEEIVEAVVETKSTETKATKEEPAAEEELTSIVDDFVAVDPNEPIPFINLLSVPTDDVNVGDFIEYNNKNYKVMEAPTEQSPIFKFLEVDVAGKACNNTTIVNIEELSQNTNISEDNKINTKLHEDSTKENDKMAEQVVEQINLSDMISGKTDTKKEVATATVAAPRVADLVEKTGEAMLRANDSIDLERSSASKDAEDLAELKSQLGKYRDEIKAMQTSKMQYAENSRSTSQFSNKEMANAVILAKLLNKRDVFDTKFGTRMKAVTTVDQFLSNFSSNIYTEMEQRLVVAPMFTRLAVDAKTFRVPVADEDTDGDVAMFKSGTFATGVGDNTNVPTSNQNTISAVEFTPHKFMATTHLAKDEEEDAILPLLDFLRQSAVRRMSRAIDKSILRGTGALTGFTASPTNAIAVGTGYASVIAGISKLAATASLAVATGSSTDKADPSDIAAARTAMGKYGLQLGNDLVYVTSIEGYNNLVTTADFQTVDKFGPNATYLTGSVGAVYGIPIIVSEFIDSVGTTGNNIGALIYKPGFMIAERRGIEIESEYEARQQVTAMYMSTRIDFKALTTNSGAALDSTKYAYAVNVNAG